MSFKFSPTLKSRSKRIEETRNRRRIYLVVFFTLILLGFFLFKGVPFLINFSLFIGNIKNSPYENLAPVNSILLPPRLEPLFEATNSARISLRGYAQAGKNIEIFKNDRLESKVLSDKEGNFYFDSLFLEKGENRIHAFVEEKGFKSQSSNILNILFSKTPPKLEIIQPADNITVTDESKEVKIEGKTDIGTTITINERLAAVKENGTFSFALPLNEGENQVKITALDKAGNKTTVERKITYISSSKKN